VGNLANRREYDLEALHNANHLPLGLLIGLHLPHDSLDPAGDLGEDYVRTARAKGMPEYVVFMRHALRNALLPIITVVSLRFGYMIGGAVITESIFAWPGWDGY